MENLTEITCPNCGEKLPTDSSFCTRCGTKIESSSSDKEPFSKTPGFMERNKKKIGVLVAVVLGIIAILLVVNALQASKLKEELKRDWSTVEGEDGAYILCILDFSDDEIEYRLETGYSWMDTTVATFDYKVISGNKIKVLRYGDNWETFTIEFNEDKTMMIVRPALTSIEDKEYWFNID